VRTIFTNYCAQDMTGPCRPLSTIREVAEQQPSVFTHIVWTLPQLSISSVSGNLLSLYDIESFLRYPPFSWKSDPRFLTCIVKATVSSPDLRNRSYSWENIDEEMSQSSRAFLANPQKGSAVTGLNTIKISDIFRQYSSEFINPAGSSGPVWFIKRYGPPAIQQALNSVTLPQIEFLNYDWTLNGDTEQLCPYQRTCFPWWAFLCVTIGILSLITLIIIIKKRLENPPDTNIGINFEE